MILPKHLKSPLFVIGTLLLILEFTALTYAYASPNVTAGHVLYNVKIKIEQWSLRTTTNPIARIEKYMTFVLRRIAEAKLLVKYPDKTLSWTYQIAPRVQSVEDAPFNPITETIESALETTTEAIEEIAVISETTTFLDAVEITIQTEIVATEALEEIAGEVGIGTADTMGAIALGINDFESIHETFEKAQEAMQEDGSFSLLPEEGLGEVGELDRIFVVVPEFETLITEEKPTFDEVFIEISDERGEAEQFTETLVSQGVEPAIAEQFTDRVLELEQNAEEFLEVGNVETANEFIEKTDALMEQAEHFLNVPLEEEVDDEAAVMPTGSTSVTAIGIPEPALTASLETIEQTSPESVEPTPTDFTWIAAEEISDGLDWDVVVKNALGQVVERIDDKTHQDRSPSLAGSLLVWQRLTSQGWEIMGFIRGATPFAITANTYDDTQPKTDGAFVVWQGLAEDRWSVFIYYISTGAIRRLSEEGRTARNPFIEGVFVRWKEWENETWVDRFKAITELSI